MSGGPLGRFGRDLAATVRGSVEGIRGDREERARRREAEKPPGLVAEFSNAAHRGNQTLRVFEDRIELSTQNVLSADSQNVRYGRISAVARRAGLSGYSTVVIETRGGGRIAVYGLPNAKAAAAVGLIEERLT